MQKSYAPVDALNFRMSMLILEMLDQVHADDSKQGSDNRPNTFLKSYEILGESGGAISNVSNRTGMLTSRTILTVS